MKAQTIDRIELTRRKMAFKEAVKHAAEVPAYPGAEEHTEPQFHSEKCSFNDNICPFCGGELIRFEGCYRCKKCGWNKCG